VLQLDLQRCPRGAAWWLEAQEGCNLIFKKQEVSQLDLHRCFVLWFGLQRWSVRVLDVKGGG